MARQLLSSGQLERHPTYGLGQGPHYAVPYATWLERRVSQGKSVHGPPSKRNGGRFNSRGPVEDRAGLDERERQDLISHIELAESETDDTMPKKKKKKKTAGAAWREQLHQYLQ